MIIQTTFMYIYIAHVIPGLLLLAIPLVGAYPLWCVALITLSFAFNGGISLSGYQNVHELAPNYTSTMMSMIVTISTTTGYISPVVVAYFTREKVQNMNMRIISLLLNLAEHYRTLLMNGDIFSGSVLLFTLFQPFFS